jgi:hypothetical protein
MTVEILDWLRHRIAGVLRRDHKTIVVQTCNRRFCNAASAKEDPLARHALRAAAPVSFRNKVRMNATTMP